jgi:Fe-S oxidoreductase
VLWLWRYLLCAEEAVSVKMGKDRVADHLLNGAEYITAADMSCLMHMEGILRRQKSKVKVIHIAEILNAEAAAAATGATSLNSNEPLNT